MCNKVGTREFNCVCDLAVCVIYSEQKYVKMLSINVSYLTSVIILRE